MRRWERARDTDRCGNCDSPQVEDTPIVVLTPIGDRRRIRCASCMNEAPNLDELEAFDVAKAEPVTSVRQPLPTGFTSIRSLAKDYKAAQTGERE